VDCGLFFPMFSEVFLNVNSHGVKYLMPELPEAFHVHQKVGEEIIGLEITILILNPKISSRETLEDLRGKKVLKYGEELSKFRHRSWWWKVVITVFELSHPERLVKHRTLKTDSNASLQNDNNALILFFQAPQNVSQSHLFGMMERFIGDIQQSDMKLNNAQ